MSVKCIIITKENRNLLGQRFNVEPQDLEDVFPLDYYLIAGFGDDWFSDALTKAEFDLQYNRGVDLLNGFFEVTAK